VWHATSIIIALRMEIDVMPARAILGIRKKGRVAKMA